MHTVIHCGNLFDFIRIEEDEFDFSSYYEGEEQIMKPRLEKLGYSRVVFRMGEQDSFGPLSRLVYAEKDGQTYQWYYG